MPADIGLDRPPPRHAYTATFAWRRTAIRFGFERSHHQITEMGGGNVAEAIGHGLLAGLQQAHIAAEQVEHAIVPTHRGHREVFDAGEHRRQLVDRHRYTGERDPATRLDDTYRTSIMLGKGGVVRLDGWCRRT